MYKTITVTADVDIELNEIKDEVLRNLDNDTLIKELNFRGASLSKNYHMLDKLYASPSDIYRHLCDIVGCGYHEPKQSVLDKLKDMM